MSRKIDGTRRRILGAYPQWTSWSNLQKSLLILRSTYGKLKQPVDATHPTTKQYARALNIMETDIERLLTDGLSEALNDYDRTGAYRKGKKRRGGEMKRPTNPEEIVMVYSYELAPTSLISVLSGARKSLTLPELEQMKLWTATEEMVQKVKYVDSARNYEKYLREENKKMQDKVWELEAKLNPEEAQVEEEEFGYDPYFDGEEEEEE